VLALPLGLAVAWVLTAVINVRAFGWASRSSSSPPTGPPPRPRPRHRGFLAAAIPVLRLARARPADLLRGFTHER
jgi:putative ABC transport system permease protein